MLIARKRWGLVSLACFPFWCSAADFTFSDSPSFMVAQDDANQQRGVTTVSTGDEMDHSQHMGHAMKKEEAHVHHGHGAGMWMFEYRFMRMYQEGLQQGTKSISAADFLDQSAQGLWVDADGGEIMAAGTDMTMDMHMFMAMYSFTDKLTLMVMGNYLANEMNMIMTPMDIGDGAGMGDGMDMGSGTDMGDGTDMNAGGDFMPMSSHYDTMFMESSGIGDTQLAMMYKLDDYLLYSPLLTVGINIPTGSIDETDSTGEVMPYDMQLGSGSYDLLTAFGIANMWNAWHVGAEASYLWRTCDNDQGYRLGNRWTVEGFVKYHLPTKTVLRTAVKHADWGKIEGRDPRISDNPNYYGGMRSDLWLGLSQELPWGVTAEAHYSVPLHQNLDGVQMPVEWQMQLALGWMWM